MSVACTILYETLEVEPTATPNEIKKSYRKLAMRYHPDKNPDAGDKFKEISRAYEVLMDEEMRAIYDRHGLEGLERGGGGGGGPADMDDIFAHFFGGGGGGGGSRGASRKRRGEDVVQAHPVSLENLYCGFEHKLELEKEVVCSPCRGKGGVKTTSCNQCRGQGYVVVNVPVMIGIGLMQRVRQACPHCRGEGEVVLSKDRCGTCRGRGVVTERKPITLYVEKGMQHGQKITFRGEANQEPGVEPGDVVLVLQQKKHPRFERRKRDLLARRTISLRDALCGTTLRELALDKRVLVLQTPAGKVIRPGMRMIVEGEGMPTWKRPFDKGNLIIEFDVDFPVSLSSEQLAAVAGAFPESKKKAKIGGDDAAADATAATVADDDVEELDLVIETDAMRRATDAAHESARSRSQYDSDSEDEQPRARGDACNPQ